MNATRELVSRTMGTRLAVLPAQAAAAAGAAYLTIQTVGVRPYATIGLLVGMQGLFTFLNLGTSASVANAAGASLAGSSDRLYSVLVSATRASCVAGGGFALAVIAASLLGAMPSLLGVGDADLLTNGAIVTGVAIGLLAPLSQGTGVLMARGHGVVATLASGATNLVSLGLVAIAAMLDARPVIFVACFYAAQVIVASWACVRASRVVGISLTRLLAAVADLRVRGARVATEARPALMILILLPIAYQTDRLLISHRSSSTELASYNLASQFFVALFSVVAAGSAALWGHFAHAREADRLPNRPAFVKMSVVFGAVGGALALCYVIAIPTVASIVSGDRISVSWWLATAFGVLLILQAFHQPSAMIQTDAIGLRFLARLVILMTLVNVALGLLLTGPFGAVGPVLASDVALAVTLLVPAFVRALSVVSRDQEATQV